MIEPSSPTWAPAVKDAVGTALGTSRVWFTIAQGIITEVYYPRLDIPQLKDLGFIVANGSDFWIEIRRLNDYTLTWQDEAIPAIAITHQHPRFALSLKICVDPERDVLAVDFLLTGDAGLQLYLLAAPRLGEDANHNLAWTGEWEGHPLLWAEQGPFGIALAAVDRTGYPALSQRSVGIVGNSDGWQDFKHNNAMTWHYNQAGPGEVALTAQLPCSGNLAVGFAGSREAAATLASQSLTSGFEALWLEYCRNWRQWLDTLHWPKQLDTLLEAKSIALLRRSATVLKVHEDHTFPGAFIASLSVPWGEASTSRGGYHLVWSRDLVETAGALLALGDTADVKRSLIYLISTQRANGHWLQNQWLGGKPFWQGIQLDETAFPVLLASALADRNALGDIRVDDMVRRALGYIVREGPTTAQDRWEEDPGINTFTVAVVIAALVEGSRFLNDRERDCALMLADTWNFRLEEYTWVTNTALSKQLGVPGYYMRSAPKDILIDEGAKYEHLLIKNRQNNPGIPADEQLAIDCLQLVRFGLRAADDPTMVSSLKAIDLLLKTDTPYGPVWHRYNGDGYGEHDDGTPFNGWGKGRGWPLLTGERGHMALLSGQDALPYLHAMARMTGKGGLLPEQVWDSEPIPERNLYPGQPNGSATPLVWAHAEFIKLALSIVAGEPVDRPAHAWERYQGRHLELDFALWQPRQRVKQLVAGQELRILLAEPAQVHWGKNGWREVKNMFTEDWGLGHVARLPTTGFTAGEQINFTFYWLNRKAWQNEDFHVEVIVKGSP
ncbi:glycoside hydrolase family 15 protein [Candidatus Methylobacter oryzae]|uniref:Glycosyl hydrolase n=1 Tax=Candidatus Methylobacter oryzae TaxID=2497749 RepID=A0ABY3CCN9_9GAMM|nr:glycoside hydrolase family 15 protein [Candidatus Methylobacter oryzae]TRW99768.1 glycosyl hydrolase [Candidatus Methylobacter oryzae]